MNSCAFSPDGKLIVSAAQVDLAADSTNERRLKLWDADGTLFGASGQHTVTRWETRKAPPPALPLSVEAKHDDSTSDFISRFDAWNAKRSTTRTIWSLKDWFHGCAFSADGLRLATASGDNKLQLWDLPDVTLLYELPGLDEKTPWRGGGAGMDSGWDPQ